MEAGLVNLKTILNKKRQEINDSLANRDTTRQVTSLKIQNQEESSLPKRKKQNIKRNEEDSFHQDIEKKISYSKTKLEQKAALYEKLKSGTQVLEHDELNEKFLINFQEKIVNDINYKKDSKEKKNQITGKVDYAPANEEEEWMEYTDSLGRTRICQRKDLESMKRLDQKLLGLDNKRPSIMNEGTKEYHDRWMKIADESKLKDDIHYQDVLFNEARMHGVGYMEFSRDEKTRRKQQDLLKELRKETIMAEHSKKANQKQNEIKMSERLAKVKQRKRLKMGLPAISLEEKKLECEMSVAESDDATESAEREDETLSMEVPSTSSTKAHLIREWDIGKYDKSGSLMTQKQWLESRRKERDTDFAPPTSYGSNKKSSTKNRNLYSQDKSYEKLQEGKDYCSLIHNESNCFHQPDLDASHPSSYRDHNTNVAHTCSTRGVGAEFAPPSTFEFHGPQYKLGTRTLSKMNVEEAIEKGLAYLRKENS